MSTNLPHWGEILVVQEKASGVGKRITEEERLQTKAEAKE
jgi:hypothetical protein